MAAGQKLYPRATVKKIVKAHSKRNVSKNVDILVSGSTRRILSIANKMVKIFLNYALFLKTYANILPFALIPRIAYGASNN